MYIFYAFVQHECRITQYISILYYQHTPGPHHSMNGFFRVIKGTRPPPKLAGWVCAWDVSIHRLLS